MMHFESPSNLKETVTNNLLTQSLLEIVPLDDTRTLRNNKVICTSIIDTMKLTFNYFSNIIIKTFNIENIILSFSSFKNFLNNNINDLIAKSNICKFNLTHKYFNWSGKS